ncbi:hypothetical protein O9929_02850 [Vibrio lentus]|nr:hypothetical protein [Vibrio lentus]
MHKTKTSVSKHKLTQKTRVGYEAMYYDADYITAPLSAYRQQRVKVLVSIA